VLQVPRLVRQALEQDASLVRTGVSAARPYGWREFEAGEPWILDAYVPIQAVEELHQQLAEAAVTVPEEAESVLLRAVDDPWPFPPHARGRWRVAPRREAEHSVILASCSAHPAPLG
jgi:hypothetical protein